MDEVADWDFDVTEFLRQSQERERRRLKDHIERVNAELEERSRIHTEIVEELESKIEVYVEDLKQLNRSFFVGKQVEEDRLKQGIEEIYQEVRRENRSHWLDCQDLESERRQLLQELEELEDSRLEEIL